MAVVCNATETFCEKTGKPDTTLDKRLDDIRNASTVVIPPETIRHLTEVHDSFCHMFGGTVEKPVYKASKIIG